MKKKLFWLFDNLEYLLSMFCMGLMMCLLFIQVISRYVFGYSLAFTEEIRVILFILSVYIGAIGGTRRGQHLKIEILTTFLNKKGQTVCQILSDLVFIVVNCFLSYGSFQVVTNLLHYGMQTPITKLPKWIPYAVIPLALVLISIRLIQDIVIQIKKLKSGELESETHEEEA